MRDIELIGVPWPPARRGHSGTGPDVINSIEFPLADFPHFNQGLGYKDALACLRMFCRHEAFGGLVVTAVNPHRDPDGSLTARLAAGLAEILGGLP